MIYQVQVEIPYEGTAITEFHSLDAVKTFIRELKCSLDEVTVIEVSRHVDAYQLMAD